MLGNLACSHTNPLHLQKPHTHSYFINLALLTDCSLIYPNLSQDSGLIPCSRVQASAARRGGVFCDSGTHAVSATGYCCWPMYRCVAARQCLAGPPRFGEMEENVWSHWDIWHAFIRRWVSHARCKLLVSLHVSAWHMLWPLLSNVAPSRERLAPFKYQNKQSQKKPKKLYNIA